MLIRGPADLGEAFARHLNGATNVYIATAWAGPGAHLEQLRRWAGHGRTVKTIVGLSGTGTFPETLRELAKLGSIRTPSADCPRQHQYQSLFHPKFYVFESKHSLSALVGSANFTNGGFVNNFEVCVEAARPDELRELFDALWGSAAELTAEEIDNYERAWDSRPRAYPKKAANAPRGAAHPGDQVSLSDLDWKGYIDALRLAEEYHWEKLHSHRVWGDERSYQAAIWGVRAILLNRDWENLTDIEKEMILAHRSAKREITYAFGLLGSMYAAGNFKAIFTGRENSEERSRVKGLLTAFAASTSHDIDAAVAVLEALMERRGTAVGAATRLMAIVRPDICVSVNNASTVRLEEHTGIARKRFQTKRSASAAYRELLEWVQQRAWFAAPEPKSPLEREAWRIRSAVVDAIVYDADRRDG